MVKQLLVLTTLMFLLSTYSSFAHHGWRWTSDTDVEVIGVIETVNLGNPHGVLTLDVEGEKWIVEVGQPWRNQRAGLSDDLLVVGKDLTVKGQRSADPKEFRVKAETVVIKGKRYVLYPDRI